MNAERKKCRKDKRHGWYVQDQDSLHIIMPYVMPGRTRNEAVMSEEIDLTALEEFIARKNDGNPDFKYTWFHAICAAVAKVLILRPKMNYYISGYRLYEHKDITLAFVVKRQFSDNGAEHLAKIKIDREGESPFEQVYRQVREIVTCVRGTTKSEGITKKFDFYKSAPRFVLRCIVTILKIMDYFGDSPESIRKDDPCYSSVFLTNLGSIKMNADYHHLSEWGDNSLFVVVGEKKKRPVFKDDGSYTMRDSIKLSMTVDERIADGYYFSKSAKLLKHILLNPELLERPAEELIEFE